MDKKDLKILSELIEENKKGLKRLELELPSQERRSTRGISGWANHYWNKAFGKDEPEIKHIRIE